MEASLARPCIPRSLPAYITFIEEPSRQLRSPADKAHSQQGRTHAQSELLL
jgi:hypothetical protein